MPPLLRALVALLQRLGPVPLRVVRLRGLRGLGVGVVGSGRVGQLVPEPVANGSNAKPQGRLKFTITRNLGRFSQTRSTPYGGGTVCIKTTRLRKSGGYTVNVAFKPGAGSVFNPSSGSDGFDVG